MSGEHAIDVADASGTLMLDVRGVSVGGALTSSASAPTRPAARVLNRPMTLRAPRGSAAALALRWPIVAGAGDQPRAPAWGSRGPARSATIGTSGVIPLPTIGR
jgi:sugar (pentulose or hexulose) kinase